MFQGLESWIPSITNMLWWSFSNSIGNLSSYKCIQVSASFLLYKGMWTYLENGLPPFQTTLVTFIPSPTTHNTNAVLMGCCLTNRKEVKPGLIKIA